MNLLSKKLPKKSVLVAGLSLGMCLSLLGLGNKVNAAEAPQTVNVGNSSKIVTYASGHAAHYGPHEVSVIKEAGTGQYLFCIEWSKRAPSNEQISKRYQANPSVQWLVNNFYSNNRFQSLGQGDEGDYWLYQSAIHWVADPNDHATWGGTGAIQDVLVRLDPGVRAKVEALRNEALKHNDESTSEIVTNNHNLGFDPGNLEIGKDDLQGNTYKKTFTLKSENMSNVHVWLKNAPEGVSLAGKDNPVNFNDVWNNTGLQLSIPYKVNADKDSYNFTVATKGNWEKTSKVAWIYSGNGNSQAVAKQDVKAVSVPLDAETDMNVTVRPAKGKLEFRKMGTGNNNTDILKGTIFKVSSGEFSQTRTTDENGYISFDNLPLGRDYTIDEVSQPNGYYRTMYHTIINNFNGDAPVKEYNLKDVFDQKDHQKFKVTKKNSIGNPLKGAQFVLIRDDSGNAHISIEEAKKRAYRKVGSELVEGHSDQEPYIGTSDDKGEVIFDMVELPKGNEMHTYYAIEIKSPDKYMLSQTSVKLPAGRNSTAVIEGELQDTTNTLPSTGSTKLLWIAGGIVALGILGSVTFYFKTKWVN